MKKVHLIFGVLVVLGFLMTGQYMDKYYNHMLVYPTARDCCTEQDTFLYC